VREALAHARDGLVGAALDLHDRVARVHGRVAERGPVLVRVGGEQRQLGRAERGRLAIERHPGRVGAAVGELGEHRAEQRAEPQLDVRRLREQPDDPAHVNGSSPTRRAAGSGPARTA
jgi:hypothetical protein